MPKTSLHAVPGFSKTIDTRGLRWDYRCNKKSQIPATWKNYLPRRRLGSDDMKQGTGGLWNRLFGSGKTTADVKADAPLNTAFAEATREDYAEWMNFAVKQKPPFPRPGVSLPAEYERWLIARNKSRTLAQ